MKKEILKTVEAYLLTNRDFLSWDDITDLENQIDYLKNELRKEKARAYLEQLRAFKKHLGDAFEELMGDDCTSDSVDDFYTSEFKINWRGKTVVIANGAEAFQAIEEIIQTEIDNEEEC